MLPLLEVKNVTYTYSAGTPFEHKALQDVSFCLNRGEFVGVIGHTGSGKSTLMQHLNGLLRPNSGDILLDGKSIWADKTSARKARFRVGLVFQYPEYQLFEETVYKDIAFGPKNMGLKDDEIDLRVKKAAEIVGVSAFLEKSPFDLSGGQKRRVAIAGVLAMEPEVLILDEPTAGLDPEGREEILKNIKTYRASQNATIVMVSHSMSDIARLTQRILVLDDGRVVYDDTPAKVFDHAEHLLKMGLDIPEVTKVFLKLRQLGLDVPPVYSIDQAVETLNKIRGGDNHA